MTAKNHPAAVSRRSFLKRAATGGALLAGAGALPAGTLPVGATLPATAAGSDTGPAAQPKATEEPAAAVLRACGSEFGALRQTN